MLSRSIAALILICAWNQAAICRAQDMRVYTVVTDMGAAGQTPSVLSHSLTLFHAGKVYDYMQDIGEVVILDLQQHRFVLLSPSQRATVVSFEELQQFLRSANAEATKYLTELDAKGDRLAAEHASAIRFQLTPTFRQTFQENNRRLQLTGDFLSYDVEALVPPADSCTDSYLTYADWAAKLNCILHPRSTFPEPRIQLNAQLREKKLLPTAVDLRVRVDSELHLRAEHKFAWELESGDKRFIAHWERQLASKDLEWISFHRYQQDLCSRKTASRDR
jgi:hypothetical protein